MSFYSDRIEILSHGGLPHGLTEDEFYRGISKPRNLKLMKIFSDLDIVEHTGHGIPTIIEKYGKNVFDISENYIMVTIPFDSNVAGKIVSDTTGGINGGINGGLNPTEELILSVLLSEPKISKPEIAAKIGKSLRTVERHLASLVEKEYIVRQGSKKTGQWKVLK